ncbi:MAG: wax ester/triacylglycerol synthase family O-acyltransferase, partial [Actinomyces sp.]
LDASFLYLESPTTPMHVGSLVVYDQSEAPGGIIRFREILELVRERLPLARCFRQKAVRVPLDLDHPWWVEDENFDLEHHVRHIALPKPGDWRQLCILTARLVSLPLDPTRPLWELWVIEGLDAVEGYPPGSFAIVSKIHHAAIDGVSGAEIFAALHDLEPGARREIPDDWRPEPDPNALELLARAGINNVTRPVAGLQALGRLVPAVGDTIGRVRRGEAGLPRLRPPVTRFNTTVSAHRVFEGRRFALADVKKVRRLVPGSTVNDVVLAVVGGALRRYLIDHDELPDRSLVAMAPVSTRTEATRGAGGNEVSSLLVPLATDVADPVDRLAAIHAATRASKELDRAIGARVLTDFGRFGPMRLASLAARLYTRTGLARRAGMPMNCVVTNVPGPQFPLYMGHARVLDIYGVGPIVDGMGLIHPVMSYDGGLTVSFTGCRDQLPDPGRYA